MQRDYKVADPSPREYEIVGPGQAHVYDVRAGRYLGRSDRVRLRLEAARGAMLAFLPYKVKGIQLSGVRAGVRQGEPVTLRVELLTETGRPGRGVFRIETVAPNGKPVAPLTRKVRWAGGVADIGLRIAFNDPVGRWTVRVKDVATGAAARAQFEVAPAVTKTVAAK